MENIALQLYTLRAMVEEDFAGTLKQVAEIGYKAVELYTYGGMQSHEVRALLDELGLEAVAAHTALVRLENELESVINEAKTIGFRYIVCPSVPPDRRRGQADYMRFARVLEDVGAKCAAAGLQLVYHNHDFEFARFDGVFALDHLFAETNAKHVQTELDLYWIHYAGQDPVEYIQKYAGRGDLLHVKDVSKVDGSFAEVGQGTLDWSEILAAAKSAGVKWYIVEQDDCPGDPLECIKTSLEFLKGACTT